MSNTSQTGKGSGMLFDGILVVVRGAGDLATGVIYRLYQAGFPVIATETPQPLAVRRTVAFAQAVYDGVTEVEGVTARRVENAAAALKLAGNGELPVLPDPSDDIILLLHPAVLVDARLLKQAGAAHIDQAPLVIGLGPGFEAGRNCHAAIETNRGHRLGRVLWQNATETDTGVPGDIAGFRQERLLRAAVAGVWHPQVDFGERVQLGQVVGAIETEEISQPVAAPLAGIVRGLLHAGLTVQPGVKLGDIDPRPDPDTIHTISDKSLAIGGAALAAIMFWINSGRRP